MLKEIRNPEIGGKFLFIILVLFFLGNGLTRTHQKSDFLDYYHASQRWETKENLYKFDVAAELSQKVTTWEELFLPANASLLDALQNQTATYIYPPLFSFLLIPLGKLSPEIASGIHSFINWLALLGIFYLLSKGEKFGFKPKFNYWVFVLVILTNFRYLESHIQNNQVGILLVFLVLASLLSKNDIVSGLTLALATSIKVTPAVFIVLFLYEKRIKALLWFFLGMILWNALPLLYDFDYTLTMTKEWITQVLGNALSNPLLRSWKNNQSLPSTLAKYFISGADFVNQPLYRLPFADLSLNTVKTIQLIIILIFGAPILLLLKRPDRKWELASLLFLASCLFSGISWIHSFVICIFPMYFLISHFLTYEWSKRERNTFLVIASLVLLTHRSVVGSVMENVFLMFSVLFYLNAALYILILYFSFKKNEIRN
ncbi:glycosyltransferase family 87 protein [Leptospira idonii]|uniref:DUF2029 domain-containing protein n=1 Tax=Leptospira idonii TaxID=1193500 RepID=A0A4R9M1B5_9LEPT|nr:glycosyltransferase family 87 protein [Leptospira idonii]TGN19751.1 DUF2029 domain-containing protein [Leptospira idonii]